MTQSPIETRHKDMAAKAAGYTDWNKAAWHGVMRVRDSILAHAQTLANLEAARADLAEIWKLSCETALSDHDAVVVFAKAACNIAAPYRASDPVAEALKLALQDVAYDAAAANGLELKGYQVEQEAADNLRAALAKRGVDLIERRDR